MDKRLKLAGAALGAAVAVVVATLVLEAFFRSMEVDDSWPAAISAVSTIVLVLVTTVYMVFTGELVKLQGQANVNMQRLEHGRTVRRAMELLLPVRNKLSVLKIRHFPLDESKQPEKEDFVFLKDNSELETLADTLRTVSAQLPHELAGRTLKLTNSVLKAIAANTFLYTCMLEVASDIMAREKANVAATHATDGPRGAVRASVERSPESRETVLNRVFGLITWEQVRAKFYDGEEFRKTVRDAGGLAEWESVKNGFFIENAIKQIDEIEDLYRSWILTEQK